MGYHPYVVLTVCCWTAAAAEISVELPSQEFAPGRERKSHHASMSINQEGPSTIQNANATSSTHKLLVRTESQVIQRVGKHSKLVSKQLVPTEQVGNPTEAVSIEKQSYIQKSSEANISSGSTTQLLVFAGTECKDERLKLNLDSPRDWTSTCYKVGITWKEQKNAEEVADAIASLIHITSDRQLSVEANSTANATPTHALTRFGLSVGSTQVQTKITCDLEGLQSDDGAVVLYNHDDDGCMTHVSRFLLHKDQATLARSGKCIAASMELEGKDKGVISMMFTGISENTILPECFKESSCPSCPQWLVDKVGADNAWYFIIGGTVVGFLLLCLILYWAWRKLNPKQGQMSEDEAYEFNMQDRFQSAGEGGHQ